MSKNRIVIDYGDTEDLFLIGVIDKEGNEESIGNYENIFNTPKRFNVVDFTKIDPNDRNDVEGYVVKFKSGIRCKFKNDEYLRLHRIVTHTSSKDIWLALKENKDLQELVDRTPDEWSNWVYKMIGELYVKRRAIVQQLRRDFQHGIGQWYYNSEGKWWDIHTRKETAQYVNTCQYPSLMFSTLDGNDNCDKLWDMVKPGFEKGFSI